jgi:hypothetical protein
MQYAIKRDLQLTLEEVRTTAALHGLPKVET